MSKRNRQNYIIDLAQLIIWAGLMLAPSLVDLTITREMKSSLKVLTGTLHMMLPLFAVYALNYYLLIPFFLHKQGKAKWFYLANAALLLAWNLPRAFNMPEFPQEMYKQFGERGISALFVGSLLIGVFIQTLIIGLAVGIRHIMRSNEEKMEVTQAELTWLKHQLNPHFLFNTLNNISSLTQIDPDKAQESIGQLSDLLRYALYDSEADKVSLAAEVEFMDNYIDLMALRCNELTTVTKELEVPAEHVEVAPLLFISLIENAFKHGVNARYPSFLKIEMHCADGLLTFRCANSLFEKQGGDHIGSGIGVENMKRRLELLYPGRYSYSRKVSDGSYQVEVTLKI